MRINNRYAIALFIIIAAHILILAKLVFFPYPELFVYSYLTKAGLLPYKQIFDQHFPGIMFFPINLASLGITTALTARYLHFAVVGTTQVLLFLVAKKVLKSPGKALLVNFLYLLWQPFFEGYVLWIDTFIPLFLLPSYYFLINWREHKISNNVFWSGLFLGLALLFKQVVAPLILLILVYVWFVKKSVRDALIYVCGVGLPIVALLYYIFAIGVWEDFIYWTVTFNLTTFAQMGRKYPDVAGFVKGMTIFGPALIGIFLCYLKKELKEYLLSLTLFFIASLSFVYARFDFIHLQPSIPFALVSIVIFIFSRYNPKLKLLVFVFIAISAIYFLPGFYRTNRGNEIKFFGNFENRLVNKVNGYVDVGDTIFALGTTPHIYELTKTLPPGRVFVFQFPWFMKASESKILHGIKEDPPKLVILDSEASVSGINLVSYMPNINKYVAENYIEVDNVEQTKLLLKK